MHARHSIVASAAIAVASVVSSTVPAFAAETISLTLLSGFPPAMTSTGAVVNAYRPAVDAQLAKSGNYKIDWNMAISGQIVKPRGELEGVEAGLGDIGIVITAFHADKLPLYKIPYVTPFTTKKTGFMAETYRKLQQQFPEFSQTWDSFNQVQVGTTVNVDNYMLISSSPLKTLADLKGKKIGAAGSNLPWVTPTGAAGVQTNLADAYNSLSTGIYNAMIVWPQAMGGFKLCEAAPFTLDADLGSASIHALNVNKDVWKGLPSEVKDALAAASEPWDKEQLRLLSDGAEKGLERCRKEFGMTYTRMSPGDQKAWAFGLPNLAQEWAKANDAKGLPATKILTAYMDAMRSVDKPVRNWDRE